MKQKIKKLFILYILGFILLFMLRIIYGYIIYTDENLNSSQHQSYNNMNQQSSNGFELIRKNYASEKISYKQSPNTVAITPKMDQKYEKIGSLSSNTNEFEKDEKNVRELIKKNKALIQYEESLGLEGKRILNLGIGVNPELFDEMILEIKKIGTLKFIQVNKSDKTNEYSDLNAQRESLEKTRDALVSFKGKGGKIDELINLENKILEVEESIQKLGVKLGEFDTENEFCTIKFSLYETGQVIRDSWSRILLGRIKTGFEWTVKYYFIITLSFTFGVFGIFIFLVVLEKLKIFPDLLKKYM